VGKISIGDFHKALKKSGLQHDLTNKILPEDVVWGEQERVNEFVRTCTPHQAHQLLHEIHYTDEYFDAVDIVLNRPDCDQATAMNLIANYYEGGMFLTYDYIKSNPEEVNLRLDKIRKRAWADDYPTCQCAVNENYVYAVHSGMIDELCRNVSHFYSLPHSFLPLTPEYTKYKKLLGRYSSPLWHVIRNAKKAFSLRG